MSQGISGKCSASIFNRGTVRDGCGEVVQEIEFVAHSVDPAEANAYWVAMCNVEDVQCGRTSSRAVGSHEAFFGKDTSLPAVYATGQSSGRGSLDAEDDGEPTVEDPVSGR
uniref:Uncharacterized protein n=1 Tax=Brassica campestris TaxID=3711 RepID=M4FAR7_BRACM